MAYYLVDFIVSNIESLLQAKVVSFDPQHSDITSPRCACWIRYHVSRKLFI